MCTSLCTCCLYSCIARPFTPLPYPSASEVKCHVYRNSSGPFLRVRLWSQRLDVSSPCLCSSKELHFTCQDTKCLTVTWGKRRQEHGSRRLTETWKRCKRLMGKRGEGDGGCQMGACSSMFPCYKNYNRISKKMIASKIQARNCYNHTECATLLMSDCCADYSVFWGLSNTFLQHERTTQILLWFVSANL